MTDSQILITGSMVFAITAVVLIFVLWVNRPLYERQPKLLTLAVWIMIAAITAAIVELWA